MQRPHILFAGGGTAGHLFPGLAVAQQLVDQNPAARITFAIPGSEFECRYVHQSGFEYVRLPSAPMPRTAGAVFRFVTRNVSGFRQAAKMLTARQVTTVVGLGGYASAPIVRAAERQRVPLVLLEQNVLPGKITRWMAASADLLCAAYEESRAYLDPAAKIWVTGNPVRREIARLARWRSHGAPREKNPDRPGKYRLVVLGGSQGAHSLNETVPYALYHLRHKLREWHILHQSGPNDVLATRQLYRNFDLPARVEPFWEDPAGVLRHADLVVSRAGGTTLAELASAGAPAILVPYPHAADNHQLANARLFAMQGACRVIDSRDHPGRYDQALASRLDDLISLPSLREQMSAAMFRRARPTAAVEAATLIERLVPQQELRHAA